jgi:6-phosphogluconolactonase (cycloisomerase 2 family)
VNGSPFPADPSISSIKTSPVADFLYVAIAELHNSILGFGIDPATGALSSTAMAGSFLPPDSSPLSLVIDSTGRLLFVGNSGSNSISAFAVNTTTGALTAVAGSPFPEGGTSPISVAVDPSNSFLVAANNGSSNVSVLRINSVTGVLTPVSGSPFATGSGPEFVVVTDK